MTKPLEVVIRPAGYRLTPAVGQGRDPAGCWAASLSYYLFLVLAPRTFD